MKRLLAIVLALMLCIVNTQCLLADDTQEDSSQVTEETPAPTQENTESSSESHEEESTKNVPETSEKDQKETTTKETTTAATTATETTTEASSATATIKPPAGDGWEYVVYDPIDHPVVVEGRAAGNVKKIAASAPIDTEDGIEIRFEDNEWCLYENDIFLSDYTGLINDNGKQKYFSAGRLSKSYTGIIRQGDEKYFIRNGECDDSYCGLARADGNLVLVTNGLVDETRSGVFMFEGVWYYVCGGYVDRTYTGIGYNEYGGWRVVNGVIDFSVTDVVDCAEGLCYVSNGHLKTDYNGFVSCASGQWYIKDGMVDNNASGMIDGVLDGVAVTLPVNHGAVISQSAYNMAMAANDFSSSTQWLILIDCRANRIGVFKGSQYNWNLEYFWTCSTGAYDTPTVKGTFEITTNRGYCFSDYDYTCYYYSGFFGPYLIHSTLYERGTFNHLNSSLGYNSSHGCVRVATANAKWVYYNIPTGTTVYVY